jgi:hypothetical protein
MKQKNAQTATEYLIILAVVIIIALIVVAVIGRVPEIGGSSGSNVGTLGWKSATIGIDSFRMSSSANDSIRIINNVGEDIRIINLTIAGTTVLSNANTNITLLVGRSIEISNVSQPGQIAGPNFGCQGITAGQKFSYPVAVTYEIIKTQAIYTFNNNGVLFEGTCSN